MGTVKHFDVDRGEKAMLKELERMRKTQPYVSIGVHESAGSYDDGVTVASVATWHEFGTDHGIPERSFIRSTMDEQVTKLVALTKRLKGDVLFQRLTSREALGLIGQRIQAEIRDKISKGIDPPLAPATVRQKNRRQIGQAKAEVNRLFKRSQFSGSASSLSQEDRLKNFHAERMVETGGKSTPLIDTGQLRNSIRYEVKDGGI